MPGRFLEKIETVMLVTVVTAVIWLFAEGEVVQTFKRQVKIEVTSPQAPPMAITPNELEVSLTLKGSTANQEKLSRYLQEQGRISISLADLEGGTAEGSRTLDVAQVLGKTVISRMGLNITAADPKDVTLAVHALIDVELPVKVDTGGVEMVEAPVVEPSTVKVRLPRNLEEAARGESVIARLNADDLLNVPRGREAKREVRLNLPRVLSADWAQDWVKITPTKATLTFTILNQIERHTQERVPILWLTPPIRAARFQITLPDAQKVVPTDIILEGPSDQIDRIRNDPSLVVGVIRPSAEQLVQGGSVSVPVRILCPEGVRVVKDPPNVTITISRVGQEGPVENGAGP